MFPEFDQHERARQIDSKSADTGQRQGKRGRRQRNHELLPRCPKRRQAGYQQDAGEGHSHTRPTGCTPAERYGDQEIHRGIFQKVDAIGKQRDRADGEGHRELDSKVGQVQNSNDDDNLAQTQRILCGLGACKLPCGRSVT